MRYQRGGMAHVRHECWMALAAVFFVCGCSKPAPRPSEVLFLERMELPALYLTERTHKRVIAPRSRGAAIDEATGERCWPALMCTAPDCPGRGVDGEPFVFIEPDMGLVEVEKGRFKMDAAAVQAARARVPGCEKCLEKRDPKRETEAERQKYTDYVQPYILPETKQKLAALDAELKRRIEFEKNRP